MRKSCPCKNDKSKRYYGDEKTPLGKGFHPSTYDEGKKKRGKSGEMYRVIKDKRGYKRWVKNITSRGGGNMSLYPNITK